MALDTKVYDELSAKACRGYLGINYGRELEKKLMLNYLQKVKARSVLDLACGAGRMSMFLAKNGYNVVGLDASYDMLALGVKEIEKFPDIQNKVRFVLGDMCNFSFGRKFDAVTIAFNSFWYCFYSGPRYDDSDRIFKLAESCIACIIDNLKKGGILLIDKPGWLTGGSSHLSGPTSKWWHEMARRYSVHLIADEYHRFFEDRPEYDLSNGGVKIIKRYSKCYWPNTDRADVLIGKKL